MILGHQWEYKMAMSFPRTYHPDYADLLNYVVNWLTSSVGSLLWDVLLQGLGIIFTVFFIER